MPESYVQLTSSLRTLGSELVFLLPEVALVLAIVIGLLSRCFGLFAKLHAYLLGLPFLLFGLVLLGYGIAYPTPPELVFGGQIRFDALALVMRFLILAFALCTLLMGLANKLPDRHDSADIMCLILGSTLGLLVLVSANSLLTMFLGLEMGSLPSYALVGLMKGQRRSSEAALKYLLYGSAASAVALFGISLITISVGSTRYEALGPWLSVYASTGSFDLPAILGLVFLFVGLGFKLSIVPMHFWTPDVFEGAIAEVGAYLSAASKAAVVALLFRLLMTLQGTVSSVDTTWLPRTIGLVLMVLAAITTSFGNLAALAQQNLKRLLAYSTIAHAGVLLAGLALCRQNAAAAVLYYLAAYLPATLIAFLVVGDLRVRNGSETIADLQGLYRQQPWVAIALGFCILSLLGLPPLGGFAGKFQIFAAYFEQRDPASTVVLAVLVINTIISAGYYLKLLKAAFLDQSDERNQESRAPVSSALRDILLGMAVAMLVITGIFWNPINTLAERAVSSLRAD